MLLPSKRQELPDCLKVKLLWQASEQAAPLTPHDRLHGVSRQFWDDCTGTAHRTGTAHCKHCCMPCMLDLCQRVLGPILRTTDRLQ